MIFRLWNQRPWSNRHLKNMRRIMPLPSSKQHVDRWGLQLIYDYDLVGLPYPHINDSCPLGTFHYRDAFTPSDHETSRSILSDENLSTNSSVLGFSHPTVREYLDLSTARCLTDTTLQLSSFLKMGCSRSNGSGPIEIHIDRSTILIVLGFSISGFPH